MQRPNTTHFPLIAMPLALAVGCAAQNPHEEEQQARAETAETARQTVVEDANVQDMMTQLEFIGCAPNLSVENFEAIWKNGDSEMNEDTLIVAHSQCWEANLEVALMARVRAGQLLFAHTQVHGLLETDDPERKKADPTGFLGYLIEGGSMTTYQSYTEFRTSADLTEAQYTSGAVARLATEEGQDSFEMRNAADTAAPLVGATDDPAGDHGPAIEAYDEGPQFSAHEFTILEEGGFDGVDRDGQSCQDCIADVTTTINKGAGSVCQESAQDWLREGDQVDVLINGGAPKPTTCANNFQWNGAGYTNHRPAGCDIAIAAGVQSGSPLWNATRDCLGTTGYTPQTTQNWAQQLCSGGDSCPEAACDFYRYGDGDCEGTHVSLWHLVDGQTGDMLFEDVGKYNEDNGTNFDWDDSGLFNGRDDAEDVCEYITGDRKCAFAEWEEEEIPTPKCGKLDGNNGDREDTWVCAESLQSEETRYVTPGVKIKTEL